MTKSTVFCEDSVLLISEQHTAGYIHIVTLQIHLLQCRYLDLGVITRGQMIPPWGGSL